MSDTAVLPSTSNQGQPNQIATTTTTTTPGNRKTMYAHQFMHHQFGKKDVYDGNLSPYVRQLIIDGPKTFYQPEKVRTRNDNSLVLAEGKNTALELARRKREVLMFGFCSDAREPYKPLGELFLDSEALIFHCLELDPEKIQKSKNERIAETRANLDSVNAANAQRIGLGLPQNQSNGFPLIRERIAKSKIRLNTVKFGSSFLNIVDSPEELITKKQKKEAASADIDWRNLKLDYDRQAYYQSIMGKNKRNATAQSGGRKEDETTKSKSQRAKKESSKNRNKKSTESSWEDSNSKLAKISSKFGTPKMMEQALNINNTNREEDPSRQFLQSREKCYEQRNRLTQLLAEDLNRMDYDRKAKFKRKFNAFDVSKNIGFVDDIANMRILAQKQSNLERAATIKAHPWFNDLINKIVMTGGIKRKVSQFEQLLIDRIQGVIEDQLPFTQTTIVRMLKVIPTTEFTKDEIQRIIRFIKQHESISEREYIEAIELAGHQI